MRFQIVNNAVTAIDFKLLFTATERVQARELAKTDAFVADMFSLLDDPRTSAVNLAMPQTASMLDYLVTQNILTEERKQQILLADAPDVEQSAVVLPSLDEPTPTT